MVKDPSRKNVIGALKDLLAEDVTVLVERFREHPEQFIDSIKERIKPLLSVFTDHERRLTLEVYQAFANLLAEAFSLNSDDALEWVFSTLKDPDFPPSPEKVATVRALHQKIKHPIVMKVIFRRLETEPGYERICQLFVNDEGKSVRQLESQRLLTWDGLQSEAQEGFLSSETQELAFRLYPKE